VSEFAATFDKDPAGYAAGRPGYSPEIFTALEERCGLGKGTKVIEIGPGTGQATSELLRRGAHVHAVEPGPALARHLVAAHPGEPLEVTVSSFEDCVLPDAESDLVVAATSFHWVEPEIGAPKALSVLRPGGSVAIWWNLFYDPRGPDEFSRALDPIFEEFGDVESPAFVDTRQEEYWIPVLQEAGLEEVAAERFPWEVEQTTEDIVALFSTFSNMRLRPAAEREQVLARIGAVADDEFGGCVRRTYQAVLYTGRKPGG
jgi:SAM-dependent methyltransferase